MDRGESCERHELVGDFTSSLGQSSDFCRSTSCITCVFTSLRDSSSALPGREMLTKAKVFPDAVDDFLGFLAYFWRECRGLLSKIMTTG